jgi:hypothetical protein
MLRKAPVSFVNSVGIYHHGFNFIAGQHCKWNNKKFYSVDRYMLVNKEGTYFFGSVAAFVHGKAPQCVDLVHYLSYSVTIGFILVFHSLTNFNWVMLRFSGWWFRTSLKEWPLSPPVECSYFFDFLIIANFELVMPSRDSEKFIIIIIIIRYCLLYHLLFIVMNFVMMMSQ